MHKKLNEVGHKVKVGASFFHQEKRQLQTPRKKEAKTRSKYGAKRVWQVTEFRKRISYLILMFATFSLNVTGLV